MVIRDMLNELSREFNLRHQVFPRLIQQGRLSSGEAEERCARLEAAMGILRALQAIGIRTADDLRSVNVKATDVNKTLLSVPQSNHIKGAE